MKRDNKNLKTGFTLTELLLVVAILAFALTAMLLVFINSMMLNASNRNLTIAMNHAQYALEEVKNTPFSSISANYNAVAWDNATISAKGLTPLNNEIITFSAPSATDIIDVTANVTWIERGSRNRSLAVETLIAKQQ